MPAAGSWGSGRMAQQAPAGVEHDFAVYGRNPSAKQAETRLKSLANGKPVEKLANRRMVGLLKMIRNMAFAHRSQHVQQGRFNSEDEVRHSVSTQCHCANKICHGVELRLCGCLSCAESAAPDRHVQVLNYVLEPFPWLLMAVYELFHEQQKVFEGKNPQEQSVTTSWLAKSGTTSSASELSSAESDGKPQSNSKPKARGKTTSGDDSQGEQKKAVRKPKKKADQQTKDAKTIQMLKDTVNRQKIEQKEQLSHKDEELSHKDEEIKKLKQAVTLLKQELSLHTHEADAQPPSTLSPASERSAVSNEPTTQP
jgi:hypothetical protein